MNERPRWPALHGLIDQLPARGWAPEQRALFMTAFETVLDLSVPTKLPPTPEPVEPMGDDEWRPFADALGIDRTEPEP